MPEVRKRLERDIKGVSIRSALFALRKAGAISDVAVRTEEPDQPIEEPPSYRDKWRQRW